MQRGKIQRIVESISEDYELTVPVDVITLAKKMGMIVKEGDFEDSLSGFAVKENGVKFIGVNKDHSPVRQRFTVAHEIGHLFLHSQDRVNYDQGSSVVMLRDGHSSEGTDMKEIEANRFAAELLMPEDEVRNDISLQGGFDLMEEDKDKSTKFVEKLAKKYNVSTQAMSIRLTTLYFK